MSTSHLPRPSSGSHRWTDAENLTLRKLWRTATDAELLAALPGRTPTRIATRARVYGLMLRDRPAGSRLSHLPAQQEEKS